MKKMNCCKSLIARVSLLEFSIYFSVEAVFRACMTLNKLSSFLCTVAFIKMIDVIMACIVVQFVVY